MSSLGAFQFQAGGDINVSSFVILDTSANNTVIQATGPTAKLIGISQEGAGEAPIPNASGLAAQAGDQLDVHTWSGAMALVTVGAGGVTAGDSLTAAAGGAAVTAATGNWVGAVAVESAAAGEKVQALPCSPFVEP